jgi:hypothetical protein
MMMMMMMMMFHFDMVRRLVPAFDNMSTTTGVSISIEDSIQCDDSVPAMPPARFTLRNQPKNNLLLAREPLLF